MKNRIFSWVRTLFAAVLSVSLVISALSAFPAARAEEAIANAATESYRYSVEIEFGAMTFCYDYGTWNPSNLRYESEETEAPAAGTVAGFPGWYGFDGISNKISVKYNDSSATVTDDPDHAFLSVSLSYRALTEKDGGTSIVQNVGGITPELYRDTNLTEKIGEVDNTVLTVAKNGSASVWLSLRGEPTVGTTPFRSENLVPIGMLTIKLGTFSATEGGN